MDTTTQEQIRQLQASVRHQRYAILSLSAVVSIGVLSAATRPVSDATFDKVTCKEWVVVDKDGKPRIGAKTLDNGKADVTWYDKDQKPRIIAATLASGDAAVQWLDKDAKQRISALTLASGAAGVAWMDKDGTARIGATTDADGEAGVQWLDKAQKPRISAKTKADGSVVFPTQDGE
ncbi:MAG: hypothetical protein QM516_01395 [Limnohabitans sp.]|nr:hypothetical protein [Limnohabitans sp.]